MSYGEEFQQNLLRNLSNILSMRQKIPRDMEQIVTDLKRAKSKEECLNQAFEFVISNFKASRIKTYLLLHRLLITDVYDNWNTRDYLHCTNLNGILVHLLLESGHFRKNDVKRRWTLLYYLSPHEYLKVKMNKDKETNVDIFGHFYGISLGDYAHGFNVKIF